MENDILWWVLGLLILLIGWSLKNIYGALNKRLNIMEQEVKEIKENYLDRFSKVNNHITDSKEEIVEKLHKLELSINANNAENLIKETARAVALALKEHKE